MSRHGLGCYTPSVKPRILLNLFIVVLVFSGSPGFSQSLRSWEKAGHLRTQRFDIFYAPSLAEEAQRLASFADEALLRQEQILGIKAPWKRLPVLLSDREYYLNGYFTAFPSNRISIQLAKAKISDELSSLADELKTLFVHELTHAITMNARSPFWSALSWLMGDFIVPPGWIVPKMFSEGTAVWMESMDWTDSGEGSAAGQARLPGRFNDPAALAPVYKDISLGAARSPWEVSGLAEFPGSGSLPYLYGALFVDYLAGRFGPEVIGALWSESGKGSIPKGFDGTLLSKGLFETISGVKLEALWQDFLASLESVESGIVDDSKNGTAESLEPLPLISGRIGPYCAAGSSIYYLDLERWGVYQLSLRTGAPAKRLFAADPYIEYLRLSPERDALLVDWVRSDGRGELQPALYRYDLVHGRLDLVGMREEPPYAEAALNLSTKQKAPFLYRTDGEGFKDFSYGLIRIGALTLPARVDREGSMEILESPIESVSSLSLGHNNGTAENTTIIALGLPQSGKALGLALLIGDEAAWTLWIQDTVFPGGTEDPAIIDSSRLVFKSSNLDGRQSLQLREMDKAFLDSQGHSVTVSWIPLQRYREGLGLGAETEKGLESKQDPALQSIQAIQTMREERFPLALETSRYPYADRNSLGIQIQGMDITERLAWAASAGWHFGASMPEASLSFSLSPDTRLLELSARDSYSPGALGKGFYRVMGLGVDYEYYLRLLPLQRLLWTGISGSIAGMDDQPTLQKYFAPDLDYLSMGTSLQLGYSDQYSLPFFPFDPKGVQASLAVDYESLSSLADGASFSGRFKLSFPRPALQLSLFGAYSLDDQLVFAPAGRFFLQSSDLYPSALAAPYPYYTEYARLDSRSSWYGFGELLVRFFSVSPWKALGVLRMPWLPAWTIGSLGLSGGFRAAALSLGSTLAFPSSAFLSLEIQLALLAGLAAEGRLVLDIEAAWAFDSLLSDGDRLHIGLALGMRI